MTDARSAILVVANPISGRGRGRAVAERLVALLREAGEEVFFEFTRRAGDARSIAASLDQGIGRLGIVGGDGTVNEVVSGLPRFDVPLAVLPMGTANLLGTALALGRRPEQTAAALCGGRTVHLDVGDAGDRRFLSVAGVGFDAVVGRELNRRRHGSITKLSYCLPVIRALLRYRPVPLVVTVDDQVITENAAWVVMCNVKEYAAYFQFTPDADPTDGRLDLCVLNDHGRWALIRTFFTALRHRHGASPAVSYPCGRSIKISSPTGAVPYELDGDYVGETPLRVRLRPGALPVLVP